MSAQVGTLESSDRRLGELGPVLARYGLIAGAAALLLSIIIGVLMGDGGYRFFKSYLVAYMFVLTIALGGLFFTILHHLVKAGWSVVVRRLAEGIASNLQWAWIFFIPILVGMLWGGLYHHWTDPALLDPASPKYDVIVAHKAPYLNVGFWIVRAAIFLAVWAMLARFFVNNSIAQDLTGDVNITRKLQWYAPLAMILYGVTQSFAAIDWVMSLEPHWFSTIYPVYIFAASCTGFFSLLILCMYFLHRQNRLTTEISSEHFHDAGKLLFAFGIVFWAYIAYSQYMLLWYANIPETSGWVITRQIGPWQAVSIFLLVGHFAGPFLILISRHAKRAKAVLAAAAGWMLLMHFVDIYWLAMPTIPPQIKEVASYAELEAVATSEDLGYGWHILDVTLMLAFAGLLIAGTAYRLSKCSLIPEKDPRLGESLAFHNI